eukprot:scaffold7651_cov112-Isochrysis_galbana.AAC.1
MARGQGAQGQAADTSIRGEMAGDRSPFACIHARAFPQRAAAGRITDRGPGSRPTQGEPATPVGRRTSEELRTAASPRCALSPARQPVQCRGFGCSRKERPLSCASHVFVLQFACMLRNGPALLASSPSAECLRIARGGRGGVSGAQ